MSVSKWSYIPEKCDGEYCVGDCDMCEKASDMRDKNMTRWEEYSNKLWKADMRGEE